MPNYSLPDPFAGPSTGLSAARTARVLVREWWTYLGVSTVIAAGIIVLRLTGLVSLIGEREGSWWGITGVTAMAVVIGTVIFSIAVPAVYLRPAFAAGITRTAMGLAWTGVSVIALATGSALVALIDGLSGLLATAGWDQVRPDPAVVIDLGPGLPQDSLTASLTIVVLGALTALVLAPTAVLLFRRFPWWVAIPIAVVALLVLSGPMGLFSGVAGVTWPLWFAALVPAGLAGWWMLRSVPIRAALDVP